nr:MAG TPA: hypothetical protein [Caudoviricetes sp.]
MFDITLGFSNKKLRYVLLKLPKRGFVGVSATTHGAVNFFTYICGYKNSRTMSAAIYTALGILA